jgi:hypothetical protein
MVEHGIDIGIHNVTKSGENAHFGPPWIWFVQLISRFCAKAPRTENRKIFQVVAELTG